MENYKRAVSNLCITSKILKKLILKRIEDVQSNAGANQHAFKKCHSTSTAGLTIQSLLAHALDNNNYAALVSLDLSATFAVINIKLRIKRMHNTKDVGAITP